MAGTVRLAPLVAFLVVLLGSMEAHGALSCLSACNPHKKNNDCCAVDPEFGAACGTYIALRAQAEADLSRERFDACVAGSHDCQPTTAGRCTIIHSCVDGCRDKFFPHIPEAQIQNEAFGKDAFLCDGRPLKSQDRRRAAKACRRCDPASIVTTTTTSSSSSSSTSTSSSSTTSTSSTTVAGQTTSTGGATTSTTTGTATTTVGERILPIRDQCFNSCLMRLDSVKRCYRRCASACEGDFVALPICQRSCRNASCLAVKARCTFNERNADKIDPQYSDCCCDEDDPNDPDCNSDRPDCRTPDEAECETTTTTTSTTTSSSTSSAPQATTTTTSPQP